MEGLNEIRTAISNENIQLLQSCIIIYRKKLEEVVFVEEEFLHKKISNEDIYNPKRHLNRSRLHLNDADVSLFVKNFRDFLNNFEKIWLQNKHSLTAYSTLSFNANISYTPMANNDLLEIQQQRVDNAKSIIWILIQLETNLF